MENSPSSGISGETCVFVTVVRDHAMYARLLRDNPNNAGHKIYNPAVWADKGYVTTADAYQSTYTAGMPKVKAGALIIETQANRIFSKKN